MGRISALVPGTSGREKSVKPEAPKTYGEFHALPTIGSQFPLRFTNGAVWNTFTGHCAKCNGTISGPYLRGRVHVPFGETYVLEAWGLCGPCNLLTRYEYRLLPDMSMVGRDKNGDWAIWAPIPSQWNRFRRFFRRLCSGA